MMVFGSRESVLQGTWVAWGFFSKTLKNQPFGKIAFLVSNERCMCDTPSVSIYKSLILLRSSNPGSKFPNQGSSEIAYYGLLKISAEDWLKVELEGLIRFKPTNLIDVLFH